MPMRIKVLASAVLWADANLLNLPLMNASNNFLMSLGACRGVPEAALQATPCRKLTAALVSMGGDLSVAGNV